MTDDELNSLLNKDLFQVKKYFNYHGERDKIHLYILGISIF